jgi:glycine/D-amino acid oxidase-like deaminating enzyme
VIVKSIMSVESTGRIVIVGGGIHAVSIAYYLGKRGAASLVVERSAIAAAASGKSGGFLAREWGSGPTAELHEKSFDLHESLATELNIVSFRRIPTLSVNGRRKAASNPASWLDGKATASLMDGVTAQVTPTDYCTTVWAAAVEMGAELKIATAMSLEWEDERCTALVLDSGERVAVDKLVVAAGPWSGHICEEWFGLTMPMSGIKSTSIVYENSSAVQREPYAVFCDEDENACHLELYPRADGSVYICGCGGSDYINNKRMKAGGDCATPEQVYYIAPALTLTLTLTLILTLTLTLSCEYATSGILFSLQVTNKFENGKQLTPTYKQILPDPVRVAAASKSFESLSSLGRKAPDTAQACMRPCLSDALPAMGVVPRTGNCYLSAGHNCWGILWAPISGLCMSELLLDGVSSSVNLQPFDPGRFSSDVSRRGGRGRKQGETDVGEQW